MHIILKKILKKFENVLNGFRGVLDVNKSLNYQRLEMIIFGQIMPFNVSLDNS